MRTQHDGDDAIPVKPEVMKEVCDQFLATLARTERMTLRELSSYQQHLLRRLIRHAYDHLPFYRDRLRCLVTADGSFDLRRWNEVPLLTRDDVVRHGGDIRVADLDPFYGEVAESRTSGSTGVPLTFATNSLVFIAGNALLTRMARRFGMDTSRALAAINRFADGSVPPYPDGGTNSGWSFADPNPPHYQLELTTSVACQIEWLRRRGAPYLATYPSGALAIADAVTPPEGRALGIETVLMNGETVPDGAREHVAERLGARAAAFYSCQEIGHIASECEAAAHYHVDAENALVEIVDERGHDVRPGERGRVVVTGLYNYAMPFIRYQLGDFAVAGDGPCACGRALPIIVRVLGRTRNAFMFRDGKRVWPRAVTVRPMHAFVPFRRYQMVQRSYEQIEFRYVPDEIGAPARSCGPQRICAAHVASKRRVERGGNRGPDSRAKRQI